MNSYVALLDFDGVILRNTASKKFIQQRVNTYFANKLPNVPPKLLHALNHEMYSSYGHSHIGLKEFRIPSSIIEFNNFIYSDIPSNLKWTSEEQKDWTSFYSYMNECDIPIYIFSNAPKEWCQHFINFNNYKVQFIQDEVPFMKHPQLSEEMVKPRKGIYDLLKMKFARKKVIFMDDKLCNLQPSVGDPRWINVWIHADSTTTQQLWDTTWVSDSYVHCLKSMNLDI